ncbi:PREDICTED: scaffold attachment factor B2-like [Branchiostoma belcheri]|uniref:Scaffold attachment factor B2-like n=1 Tax=Branchiostoma belcheri TaxID=7741 RepID=A0A6P4Y9B4_BRABE|nr:PREDICTED: scaffold attachment factor B2-like [Branchiostoma belcheri]
MAIEKKKLSDLRVVDLREELEKRGLEKGGTKPVLIERLKKAIQDEGGDPNEIEVEAGDKLASAKKAAGARRTPVRRTKKEEQEQSTEEPAEEGMDTETADLPDSLSLKDEPMDDLDVLDEDDSLDQEMDTIDDLGEEDGESESEETSAGLNGEEDQKVQEGETAADAVAMETGDAPETVATVTTDGEEGKGEVSAAESADVPSSGAAEATGETPQTDAAAAAGELQAGGAAAPDTEMDAASLVDKVLNETGEAADDVALSAEQEEELLTEDEVGEGEAETPADQKEKEGSNKNTAAAPKPEPSAQPAKPAATGAKVVAPGDAPVPFPLTSKDLLEMHALPAATKDEEENISLVVHADDQMIADLDADLLDMPKDAESSADAAPATEEPGKTQEKAEEASKEAPKEGDGAKKAEEEGKAPEEAGKKAAEAGGGEKNKESSSSSAKKSPSGVSSVRTRSASGKDTKDAKAPPGKDEKARHGSSSSSSKNLWVSGLSSTTRATDLKAAFSKYGKVVGAKVVTNARSPGARCYGFVTMSSSEEAARCITHLHRTELHGRMISVERAKNDPSSSSKKPPEKKEPEKRDLRSSSARKPSADARKPAPKTHEKDKKEPEKKPEDKKDEKEEKKEEDKRSGSQSRRSTGDKAPASKDKESADKEGADKDGKEGTRTVVMDKKKGEPVVTVKDSNKRDSKSKEKDGQQPRKGSKEKQGEILSFDKIKEQRERERQRQRERELREMERRRVERERRERERQREIIQREREERERLQRERERLQRERERLEREKQERERLERERMRIERERAREQERIAREREETRRLQLQLEEERRQLKRALEAPRERDTYWSEPKRQYEGEFHRGAPETNRFNDYDNRERGGAGYTRDVDHRSAAPPPGPYERRVERYDRRDNAQRRDDQPRYNDAPRDVPPDNRGARVPGSGGMRGAGGMDPISKGMSNPTSSMSYVGREPAPVGMQSHDSHFPLDERRPRDPPRDDGWGPVSDERTRTAAPSRGATSSYSDRQIGGSVGDNRPGLLGSAPSRGGGDSRGDWSSGERLRKAEPQRQPGTDGHGWPMGGLENPTVNRLGERWPGSMGQQAVESRGGQRVLAVSGQTMSQHQRAAGGYISQAPQHHTQPPQPTQLLSRAPAVGGGFGGPDRHKPAQDNRFDPYSRAPPARRY